jgi:hypothetical protein
LTDALIGFIAGLLIVKIGAVGAVGDVDEDVENNLWVNGTALLAIAFCLVADEINDICTACIKLEGTNQMIVILQLFLAFSFKFTSWSTENSS